jgi:hypothetical protein
MDAGLAINPVVSVVSTRAATPVAVAPAVPTELAEAKVVGPVINPAPARNEPRQSQASIDTTTRDAIIDPQTNEVVYRVLDTRTRQVLQQVPDQAMLRMQAYASAKAARALADGKNPIAASESVFDSINTVV